MAGIPLNQEAPVDSETTPPPPPPPSSSSSSSSTSNTNTATTSTALTNDEPPQVSGRLTIADAEAYLNKVKEVFVDQRIIYLTFLTIMRDFKTHRIGRGATVEKVKELFEGHNDLIRGFDTFLPEPFKIIPAEAPSEISSLEELDNFLNKMKTRFQDDHYDLLIELIEIFTFWGEDLPKIKVDVSAILQGHPDLLQDFYELLP